jgi:hypothetical protein
MLYCILHAERRVVVSVRLVVRSVSAKWNQTYKYWNFRLMIMGITEEDIHIIGKDTIIRQYKYYFYQLHCSFSEKKKCCNKLCQFYSCIYLYSHNCSSHIHDNKTFSCICDTHDNKDPGNWILMLYQI